MSDKKWDISEIAFLNGTAACRIVFFGNKRHQKTHGSSVLFNAKVICLRVSSSHYMSFVLILKRDHHQRRMDSDLWISALGELLLTEIGWKIIISSKPKKKRFIMPATIHWIWWSAQFVKQYPESNTKHVHAPWTIYRHNQVTSISYYYGGQKRDHLQSFLVHFHLFTSIVIVYHNEATNLITSAKRFQISPKTQLAMGQYYILNSSSLSGETLEMVLGNISAVAKGWNSWLINLCLNL